MSGREPPGDVAHVDGDAVRAGGEHDVAKIARRAHVAAPAHHVLGAAKLDETAARLAVAAAHRFEHFGDGDVVGPQTIGIHVHLVLPDEAAQRRDLGHARDRFQVIAQVPVLKRAQFRQVVLAGGIDQHVLEDPADAGGVGPQFGADALRQAREHARKILERAGAGPVDVRALVENRVDVGVAEIGEAAHGLDSRRAQERADDRISHLVFDDIRAAVPAGVNDDLRVAQIRDGVERHVAHGPPARDGGGGHQQEDRELVAARELDDPVNHARPLPRLSSGSRSS